MAKHILSKETGFSLIEALISLAVLSIGLTTFAKAHSHAATTQIHIRDQLSSLHLSNEINNALEAHASSLSTNDPTEFTNSVNAFAAALQDEINARGQSNRTCSAQANQTLQEPKVSPQATPSPSDISLTQPLKVSAPTCITITVSTTQTVPNTPNVWVNTRVTWLSRGIASDSQRVMQSIDSAKLLIPQNLDEGATVYWQ